MVHFQRGFSLPLFCLHLTGHLRKDPSDLLDEAEMCGWFLFYPAIVTLTIYLRSAFSRRGGCLFSGFSALAVPATAAPPIAPLLRNLGWRKRRCCGSWDGGLPGSRPWHRKKGSWFRAVRCQRVYRGSKMSAGIPGT